MKITQTLTAPQIAERRNELKAELLTIPREDNKASAEYAANALEEIALINALEEILTQYDALTITLTISQADAGRNITITTHERHPQ